MFSTQIVKEDFLTGSPLVKALIDGEHAPFFNHPFTIDGLSDAADQRVLSPEIRSDLVNCLLSQYASIEGHGLTTEIESLQAPTTFTVTTGHQLTPYAGPMFLMMKAFGVIKLAQQLNEQWADRQVQPIFWLASEDHDFDEISTVSFKKELLQWSRAIGAATGRMSTAGLPEINKDLMGNSTSKGLQALLVQAEDQLGAGGPLSQFIHWWLHELFGKHGLLLLDADRPQLKRHFSPYMWREIQDELTFESVTSVNELLRDAGHKVQVNPRKINLFYFEDGQRVRLEKTDSGIHTVSGKTMWSLTELKLELEKSPALFSPNVLMRPLYQEVVLPNLAYIGGPGEVQYWGQLKSMFERFKVAMPVVGLRPRGAILSGAVQRKLKQLDLSPEVFFKQDLNAIKTIVAGRKGIPDVAATSELVFAQLRGLAKELDQTLPTAINSIKSLQARWEKDLNHLEQKIWKAAKEASSIDMARIVAISEDLFPGGISQERVLSVLTLIEFYGLNGMDQLLAQIDPLAQNFTLFTTVENS